MSNYRNMVILLAWLAPVSLILGHGDITLVMYAIAIILLIFGIVDQHRNDKR